MKAPGLRPEWLSTADTQCILWWSRHSSSRRAWLLNIFSATYKKISTCSWVAWQHCGWLLVSLGAVISLSLYFGLLSCCCFWIWAGKGMHFLPRQPFLCKIRTTFLVQRPQHSGSVWANTIRSTSVVVVVAILTYESVCLMIVCLIGLWRLRIVVLD